MKVYIAGPMSGLPDFNYLAFVTAEKRLRETGYETLNPVDAERDNPTPGVPQPWQWYMRKAIVMVAQADGIALLPGWQDSRGARLETIIGEALGIRMRSVEGWLTAQVRQP